MHLLHLIWIGIQYGDQFFIHSTIIYCVGTCGRSCARAGDNAKSLLAKNLTLAWRETEKTKTITKL